MTRVVLRLSSRFLIAACIAAATVALTAGLLVFPRATSIAVVLWLGWQLFVGLRQVVELSRTDGGSR